MMEGLEELPSPEALKETDCFAGTLLGRIGGGVGALGLSAVLNVLSQVALVPLALAYWGKVRYGEWIVLASLVIVLKVTDLGLQAYAVNRMCMAYSRGERLELQTVMDNAIRVQMWLGLLVFCGMAIVLGILPAKSLLGLTAASGTEVKVTILLLTTELLLGVPAGVLAGVYRATGRLPRAAFLGSVQQAVTLVATLVLIRFGSRFDVLAAVRLAVTIGFFMVVIYDLRRIYPWLSCWPRRGGLRAGIRLLGPGLLFLLLALSDWFQNQLLVLVVQAVDGGSAVARFATLKTASNMALMGGGLLLSAVWPELTRLHAVGDHIGLSKLVRRVAVVHVWLVGVASLLTLPLAAVAYRRWTAGEFGVDWWTLSLLGARVVVWAIWSPALTFLGAINRQRSAVLALLINAGVTAVAAILLVGPLGVAGAALANLAGDVCTVLWILPMYASRELHERPSAYFRPLVGVLTLALTGPFLVALGLWLVAPNGAIRAAGAAVGILLSGVSLWRLIDGDDRAIVLQIRRAGSSRLTGALGRR